MNEPYRIAAWDQAIAGIRDTARLMATMRDHYMDAGFTRAEAIDLVVMWWQTQLDEAHNRAVQRSLNEDGHGGGLG